MRTQGKVSMVVPCYNKAEYIGDMLRSVYEQVWDNIEVILVNDGSTDGTGDVIAQWEPKLRERGYDVIIVNQENAGCCAAVHAGLIRMTGDYFCLVDCDDEIMPEYVSRMAGWLDEHRDYEWAACHFVRILGDGNKRITEHIPVSVSPEDPRMLENWLLWRFAPMAWIYMMRVSYVKQCGMIDYFCTDRHVSYEPCIVIPAAAAGRRLKFFNEELYKFNKYANALCDFPKFEKMLDYYDDYMELSKWVIDRLNITDEKKKLYKNAAALTNSFRPIGYQHISDSAEYSRSSAEKISKIINEVLTPAPNISADEVQELGLGQLFAAVGSFLFGREAQLLCTSKSAMRIKHGKDMRFVIFGAGGTGLQAYGRFCDVCDIINFCDNNTNKQGKSYLKLPVIAPEEFKGRSDLTVIIPPSKTHFEKAQQLFNLGIKSFYLVHPDNHHMASFIDLTGYTDLSYNPNRICVIEPLGIGHNARALMQFNPYNDIDVVTVEHGIYEPFNIYESGEAYYAYHTSALFITQGINEVHNKKCIELWHAFLIKSLNYASNDSLAQSGAALYADRLNNERNAVCSYSQLYSIFFSYCMGVRRDKLHITGMPRNDLLLCSDAKNNMKTLLPECTQYSHIILYLPTFREAKTYSYNDMNEGYFFLWPGFSADDFDMFLRERNALLLYKTHAAELAGIKISNTKNIKLLTEDMLQECGLCLYELLGASDLLITDYSSVAVDYLLLDKPIVYTIRDEAEYSQKQGLLTEPFDAWASGEAVREYEELKTAIHTALFEEDKYKDKREQIRRIMHKYHDGESTRRVLDLARSILEQKS